MSRLFRHPVSCLAILVATSHGCADLDVAPDEARTTASIISPYIGQQGRLLLGFKTPDSRLFSFAGSLPATTVGDQGQLIAGATTGIAFTGVTFTAGDGTSMRIAQVFPPVAPTDKWEYLLEQLDSTTGTWVSACDAPNQLLPPTEPVDDPPHAIAMPGLWFGPFYWVHPTQVTFSCKTGVAAKCDGWGYPVTAQWPHTTKNGTPTWASGADMMQTCTRMARADYCANGMPNTLAGTPIQIDDVFTHTPPWMPGYFLEAAWTGKAINDSTPQALPVVCLSKLRWSTLPLGGNCPLQLVDPRINAKAKFCEDYETSPLELEKKGALIYSASTFIDAGLYTYTSLDGALRLTTASLLPQKQGEKAVWQIPEPAGVPFPILGQPVRFEATIFAANSVVAIPDTELLKLQSYQCPNDLMTTTSEPTIAGCSPITLEGYVYPPNTAGRAPLRRWVDPVKARSNTTAVSPTEMMANGWKLAEVVGGVLRAAINVNLRWGAVPGGYTYSVDVQTPTGWINGCFNNALLGSQTSLAYTGACPSLGGFAVNHSDIIGFRINATPPTPGPVLSQPVGYDGFSSDVYVVMPNSTTAVLAVSWRSSADTVYSLDVHAGTKFYRCADTDVLANDTSYVHTGRCWSANMNIPTHVIDGLRLCAYDRGRQDPRLCRTVEYDGSPKLVIKI